MYIIVRFKDSRQLAAAFQGWLQYARRCRRNSVVVKHAAELARTRLKKLAFDSWWQHHESHTSWRVKLLQLGKRQRMQALRHLLSAWRAAAADHRAKRQVTVKSKSFINCFATELVSWWPF
jgi:hypothetical protein